MTLTQFDHWLTTDGPAALVIREYLDAGRRAGRGSVPGHLRRGRRQRCSPAATTSTRPKATRTSASIDSVGSQANRIEPIFAKEKYADLVPQIVVKAGREVGEPARSRAPGRGRPRPLLGVAEGTARRLQGRAEGERGAAGEDRTDVARVRRVGLARHAGQTAPAGRVHHPGVRRAEARPVRHSSTRPPITSATSCSKTRPTRSTKDAYAERGFIHVPASGSHGGVIATGGIRRDATLSLAALRLLAVGEANGTRRRRTCGGTSSAWRWSRSRTTRPATCGRVATSSSIRTSPASSSRCTRRQTQAAKLTHDDALNTPRRPPRRSVSARAKTVRFDPERAKKDVKGEGDVKRSA